MQFLFILSVFVLFIIGGCGNNILSQLHPDWRRTGVHWSNGWADGDIITIYFNHTNDLKDHDYMGAVNFTFGNVRGLKFYIWIMFTLHPHMLCTYSNDHNKSLPGDTKFKNYDKNPHETEDFLKVSKNEVFPFFQGVHNHVRNFTNTFDDADAVEIDSKSIDHSTVKAQKLSTESSRTPQMNLENFKNHLENRKYRILSEFSSWSIGVSVNIAAYMETDTWRESPIFGFKSFNSTGKNGLAIEHHRDGDKHNLFMYTREEDGTTIANEIMDCWESPGRGDLHHFRFDRISEEKVKLTSRFLDTYEGISCEIESKFLREWFDGKVQLFVENGAVVLHTTHSGMNL